MADNIIQLPADSTGSKLDTESLTVGANTVHRQRVEIADTTTAAGLARVKNADPATNDYGLTVRALNATAASFKVDASGVAVPVTDNSGSLTVDAPVGTPVFVRLSDGSAAIATLPVSLPKPATGTNTSVAGTISTSTTILASNVNRMGATVYNDSTAVLYLSLGSTCTSTNFTVALQAASYYEVPYNFTAIITGTWATATGNARVTEVAA